MRRLAKVELHLHLEGAAPPAFIRGLAAEKHMDISGIFAAEGGYAWKDFPHFLKVYEAASSVLRTPADYRRLLLAVAEERAADGVLYGEIFLSPDFCGGGELAAWRDYLGAMAEAAREAEATLGITLRGVVTAVRHFGPEQARRAALCAAETAGDFICGFGIGGDETVLSPADFSWGFDCAREAGLGLTAHAGEWRGPEGIRDSLAAWAPSRLGHGVRAIEDLALVDLLAEREIHLELCPGSNLALGLYPDIRHHPVAELERRGVKLSISTDDPPFFRTSLAKEFAALHRAFDWEEPQFRRIALQALDAAFCDPDTRKRITAKLEG
ncbi:adenosine deaminase [Pseudogemmobacter faecipullorum]|uniref:Adenosine deaminase n=1 Tax=Pseudogemmobacter faecipullorum TaxID=2755041 RepID=A0ABS8CGI1_9RHOB|nr:adenosine deaminase [Pseudogemmobacter faecipullorum]MCB5408501.1 adenosine deaminase [Pseudogemmobacter faecipullorum]